MNSYTRQRNPSSGSIPSSYAVPLASADHLSQQQQSSDGSSRTGSRKRVTKRVLRKVQVSHRPTVWQVVCTALLCCIVAITVFPNHAKELLMTFYQPVDQDGRPLEIAPSSKKGNAAVTDSINNNAPKGSLSTVKSDEPPSDKQLAGIDPRLPELAKAARKYVEGQRAAYKKSKRLPQWQFRGNGYLKEHHNMVLTTLLPQSPMKSGRQVVQIYDVNTAARDDCSDLNIWVRVNGPEIFAGSAKAVGGDSSSSGGCHWEFPFDAEVAGKYEVDTKVVNWKGEALDNDPQSNPVFEGHKTLPWEKYPKHVSMMGFKLYDPPRSCGEACTRIKDCAYWSAPALHFANRTWSCEFYFDETTPNETIKSFKFYTDEIKAQYTMAPKRLPTKTHGPPHDKTPSYYLGCGWNFYLTGVSQCESPLDDSVFVGDATIELKKSGVPKTDLPMCELKHEDGEGRWVRSPYPDENECPEEMDTRKDIYSRMKHHDLLMFQSTKPHCWWRDDLSKLGTRCFVDGCGTNRAHIWKSSLQQEQKWFGKWKNYECEYAEFTNDQLQQCIDTRKIIDIRTHGTSVAGYINEYLQQRLSHVKLYNHRKNHVKRQNTINVTLDTFHSPHLMWHNSSKEWREEFQSYKKPKKWEEHYYVENMYFVSEREPFCTAPRATVINKDMEEILVPKGYKKLGAYTMSSAFSYDTATQMDGMHIVGPPLRMIVTKLFHHVCKDVVDISLPGRQL